MDKDGWKKYFSSLKFVRKYLKKIIVLALLTFVLFYLIFKSLMFYVSENSCDYLDWKGTTFNYTSESNCIVFDKSMVNREYFQFQLPSKTYGYLHEVFPDLQIVPDEVMRGLYQMYKDIHEIFTDENITYSLMGGSLLGQFRHGGVIPWDEEGDIIAFIEDRERILELTNTRFLERGYHFTQFFCDKNMEMDKLSRLDMPLYKSKYYPQLHNSPWIDIFYVTKGRRDGVNEDVVQFDCERNLNHFKNSYFTFDEFYPLKLANFGDIQVYIPGGNLQPYMERNFGEKWNVEYKLKVHPPKHIGYVNWQVRDGQILKSYRRPGAPTGPLIDFCDSKS